MSLRVLEPGLCTLVVDLGRPHCRSLGVPVGGAADRAALALGNALVGNPADAAALEVSLAGPTLQARARLACVVYGAPFALASARQRLTVGKTFTLEPEEVLRIGGTPAGMRAYFCVRGGIQAPVVLGSRSGLEPLRAGGELACVPGAIGARFVNAELDRDGQDQALLRTAAKRGILRALDGPQGSWFPPDVFFESTRYTVSSASNRMGLRLEGEPLPVPPRELVSEPVCPGSVQVTRDGQCIVLGVDGQTIGGYPKIAQVIHADLDRLGQLRPGDEVAFVRITLEEAERADRLRRAKLHEWLLRLRTAEVFGSYNEGNP